MTAIGGARRVSWILPLACKLCNIAGSRNTAEIGICEQKHTFARCSFGSFSFSSFSKSMYALTLPASDSSGQNTHAFSFCKGAAL